MKRRTQKKRFARLLSGDRWLYTRRQGRHDRWSIEGARAVEHAEFVAMWRAREIVRDMVRDLARFIDAVEAHRKEADHG